VHLASAAVARALAHGALTAIGLASLSGQAQASEGGASFYLLGSGGPGAAILPPIRGIFFDNTLLHYSGKSQGSKNFVVGGNLVAGLRAKIDADFATVLWVPSTNFAEGTLAIGGALAAGRVGADVSAVITGPRGGQVTVSRKDDAWIIGDPVATAAMSWNLGGNMHLSTGPTVNVPIGHYREDELANLSFHRWVMDWSTALTWHDDKSGWDVSAKAGFTFNGKNHFTDYKTGTEFHLEGAVEHMFSKAFSAGAQGYRFQQVSGDSGAGATLGPFKGRVSGLGVTAAYNFEAGHTPVTIRGRVFKEFGAENRVDDGTAIFLSIDVPLKMVLPTGTGHAAE
jgi:hypothetical protein